MQATVREPGEEPLREGQGDSQQGEQRPRGETLFAFPLILVYSVVIQISSIWIGISTITVLNLLWIRILNAVSCPTRYVFVFKSCEIVG